MRTVTEDDCEHIKYLVFYRIQKEVDIEVSDSLPLLKMVLQIV